MASLSIMPTRRGINSPNATPGTLLGVGSVFCHHKFPSAFRNWAEVTGNYCCGFRVVCELD